MQGLESRMNVRGSAESTISYELESISCVGDTSFRSRSPRGAN